MTKHYKVTHAGTLANGAVMLSGFVKGDLIEIGDHGTAIVDGIETQIIVTGVGISDPNLGPEGRQGLLVQIPSLTAPSSLVDKTIAFGHRTKK